MRCGGAVPASAVSEWRPRSRHSAAREAAKDRVMVDAVVQRILDEDTREAVEKVQKAVEVQKAVAAEPMQPSAAWPCSPAS